MRCSTSARLTAVDITSTSTSSGPMTGSGTSRTRNTSGPPFSSSTIARIATSAFLQNLVSRTWSLEPGRTFGAQIERQMLGHVADEVDQDHADVEPPLTVDPVERVVVATRHDGLQRQRTRLLADDEVRPGRRRTRRSEERRGGKEGRA